MTQLGYVVRDIHAAMAWWLNSARIGPWFYMERSVLPQLTYKGQVHENPNFSAAFANSGEMQIELIQQNCDTPSAYRDFLQAGGTGLHHWSSWPTPAQYAARRREALASGYVAEMEGGGPRGAFVYFSRDGVSAPLFEMAEMVPARIEFFGRVREAARDWDGRDPIRDRDGHKL